MKDKEDDWFWTGLLAGTFVALVFVAVIAGLRSVGDAQDEINTRELGKIMCNERGLEYDHREINEKKVPIIYCKEVKEEDKLLDGVLIKIGGN